MSLNDAALIESATMNAASGGTTLQFASKGNNLGANTLIVPADTTLNLRRSVNCNISEAKASANAPGGYTQARETLRFNFPRELTDGSITVETLEIKLATSTEATTAEKQEYLNLAAQACVDSDFSQFFLNQVIT